MLCHFKVVFLSILICLSYFSYSQNLCNITEVDIPNNYVGACLIVRNQPLEIIEWIDYHLSIGVSTFYIYDDRSDELLDPLLNSYIVSGSVVLTRLDNTSHTDQLSVYADCINKFRNMHKFLVFIDVDEFIVLRGLAKVCFATLPRYLYEFRNFGGLLMHWRIYGSSGHISPVSSVRKSYTQCLPRTTKSDSKTIKNSLGHWLPNSVKSIVNTKYVKTPSSPHLFSYTNDKYAVNEYLLKRKTFFGYLREPTYDFITLDHYILKSLSEYEVKMSRGGAMGKHRTMQFFDGTNKFSTINCTDIDRREEEKCLSSLQKCSKSARSYLSLFSRR